MNNPNGQQGGPLPNGLDAFVGGNVGHFIREQQAIEDMIRRGAGRGPNPGPPGHPGFHDHWAPFHAWAPMMGPLPDFPPAPPAHRAHEDVGLMNRMGELLQMREAQRQRYRMLRVQEMEALRELRVRVGANNPAPQAAPLPGPMPPAPLVPLQPQQPQQPQQHQQYQQPPQQHQQPPQQHQQPHQQHQQPPQQHQQQHQQQLAQPHRAAVVGAAAPHTNNALRDPANPPFQRQMHHPVAADAQAENRQQIGFRGVLDGGMPAADPNLLQNDDMRRRRRMRDQRLDRLRYDNFRGRYWPPLDQPRPGVDAGMFDAPLITPAPAIPATPPLPVVQGPVRPRQDLNNPQPPAPGNHFANAIYHFGANLGDQPNRAQAGQTPNNNPNPPPPPPPMP
jgi:hypothetical protein